MHRSVNEIAYAEGAFLLGFPISSQNRHSMRVIVGLDFTGDNRRGAPQRSNQCGDCYSTQKSVHKSDVIKLARHVAVKISGETERPALRLSRYKARPVRRETKLAGA